MSWWANNWKLVLILALVLTMLDKGITVMNVLAVKKNFPQIEDPTMIEKNPMQRWFWDKFGLYGGALVFMVFSMALFFFLVYILAAPASLFAPNNKYGVALYFMCLVYGFVIINNIYFFLRYSKILT